MTVLDELLKPCEPIGKYFWSWAQKLKKEIDGMEEVPREHQWLFLLLSFVTSNHVHKGITEGRFTPEFQIGDQAFPLPSMLPAESFPWLRDLAERSENVALQARAFDFLWEHQPKQDYRDAIKAVDAYMEVARLFYSCSDAGAWLITVDTLDRTMTLACQINDRRRAEACRDVYIEHLHRCSAAERWAELRDCTTCLLAVWHSRFKDLLEPQLLSDIGTLIDKAATTHQGREEHHGEMQFLDVLDAIRRAQGC